MKVAEVVNLPTSIEDATSRQQLLRAIKPWMQAAAIKLNRLASGSAAALDGTGTTAPSTGTWAVGDKVRNSAPSELGGSGSKYVVDGWVCVAAGTPGTWVQQRTLTGN